MTDPKPSGAVLDMLARDGELDRIMERGLVFDRTPPAPPAPPPLPITATMPAPDWEQERREREALEQERDRQHRDAIIREELQRLENQASLQARAAPKQQRRWQREQMRPDAGDRA